MTDFNQKTHDTDVGSYGGQSRQMTEVFENQEFGSIRVLQEAGKTFFCASDVAKALGYFDTFVNSEDCTCIRNFCKEIGIPEKTAVALLLDHRYLYRSPSGWLMPFADKSARGYFIVRDCYGRSGKLVQQTRVTCKGKNHLFKLFKKWGVIE